jgi:GTPase SAR1 family protein
MIYIQANAVIILVDSSDRDKFDEARNQLHLLNDSLQPNILVIILGTKTDLPGAIVDFELGNNLGFGGIHRYHPMLAFYTCCLLNDTGYDEAFELLSTWLV